MGSEWSWLEGLTISATVFGEEIGWDDDRGRPEAVTPDEHVHGIVEKVLPAPSTISDIIWVRDRHGIRHVLLTNDITHVSEPITESGGSQ